MSPDQHFMPEISAFHRSVTQPLTNTSYTTHTDSANFLDY